jgi:radical SAM protein with 4Fe4S-binding SPASM domain
MSILKSLLLTMMRNGLRSASSSREQPPPGSDATPAPERVSTDREAQKRAYLAAAKGLGRENEVQRAEVAQFIRYNLGDDHLASQAMLYDDSAACAGPLRIRLESASACNLRCQHCPTGVNYHGTDRSVMKPGLFDLVIGQMKQLPTLRECVLYLGGEPLMNKHLIRMCQRVKEETSVKWTLITTNAMLLDEKACAGLATARLDRILVSVDGRSPEENDAIRVRAKYSRIVENVALLRRHLEGTKTTITISHSMFKRPHDPDKAQTPEFLKRDFPGIKIWSDYATRWPGFELANSNIPTAALEVLAQRNFCDFPFFELAVRANGDVVLCCHDLLGESVMGNVYDADLATIWNAQAYRDLRRAMLNRDAQGVHPVCRKCFIFTGERISQSPDQADAGSLALSEPTRA